MIIKKHYCAVLLTFWNVLIIANEPKLRLKKPLLTTTIGSYPKPFYVTLPDWFANLSSPQPSITYDEYNLAKSVSLETLDRATQEVVLEQINWIDIPTDGEIRRENYVHYHCRHLDGIDFSALTKKLMRDGTWMASVPTIVGPVTSQNNFLPRDFNIAQVATNRPVKITIPGPMTITDSLADAFYYDEQKLGLALAEAINKEVLALAETGCTWIQIDEPLFMRHPQKALEYGIKHLEKCFEGIPDNVMSVVHICCGYPTAVDMDYYPKSGSDGYITLAKALEESTIKVVSIEDAHRRNDLSLLTLFKNTAVILGVIDIAQTRIESVDEIKEHILQALNYIEPDRLIIGPDCGLGMLTNRIIQAKLSNMVEAVTYLRENFAFDYKSY